MGERLFLTLSELCQQRHFATLPIHVAPSLCARLQTAVSLGPPEGATTHHTNTNTSGVNVAGWIGRNVARFGGGRFGGVSPLIKKQLLEIGVSLEA